MTAMVAVTLPGGLWLDGAHHREAFLRPLTGRDESFLLATGEVLLPVQWTTALLNLCLVRLGPLEPVTPEIVGRLATGDRQALLLHLRRLTLGERVPCVLNCPRPNCADRMELDLRVRDLLLASYPNPKPEYEHTIRNRDTEYLVRFRLPTGGDLETAAVLAVGDLPGAADLVLRRCVTMVTAGGNELAVTEWPAALARKLPVIMSELDPQAELTLNLRCAACGQAFSAAFDPAAYFSQELLARREHFYREVHLLAFCYHWSQSEIMGLTLRERQRYVEILQEDLSREARG